MTQLVINGCYGGFGLSAPGTEAFLARKGQSCFWFTDARDADGHLDFKLPKVPSSDPDGVFIAYAYTVADADEDAYFSPREIDRDDPDLIGVVETLGERANGQHASLRVVEIPDGVEWEIDEYDGLEHVAEKHRVWS